MRAVRMRLPDSFVPEEVETSRVLAEVGRCGGGSFHGFYLPAGLAICSGRSVCLVISLDVRSVWRVSLPSPPEGEGATLGLLNRWPRRECPAGAYRFHRFSASMVALRKPELYAR